MTESEIILSKFENLYKNQLHDQRIAIYGVGGHTEYILANIPDKRRIVALMDAKRVGEILYGLPVYGTDEIIGVAEAIVIVAREAVLRLVYERIKQLAEHGINIYNVIGENLTVRFSQKPSEFEQNPYWNTSIGDLKAAIDVHEVISFDIFDTLLMRRIIRPHDELGFEAEKKLTVPRKDIVECLNYAVTSGKRVFMLSDMYFSGGQLNELLSLNGINGFEEIIVSCEHGASKEDGKLYDILKSKAGIDSRKILHIGDNIQADIDNAQVHGIDTFYVMSAYDMLLNSPMYKLLTDVPTAADSCMIGDFAAEVLNSPFALNKNCGRIAIDDINICTMFFAPIVGCFLQWLVQELNNCTEDTLILFLARDGYLIKRLYDWVNEEFKLNLPASIYFLTSRSAVSEEYSQYQVNYLEYAKKAGVFNYKKVIAYDLATKGTTISKLQEIFNISILLFCFASFNINERFSLQKTYSMLGNYSYYDLPYNFLRYYELLEIMSVPKQTQFLYIDDELNPVFADNSTENIKSWDKIKEFQDCLCTHIKRMAETDPEWITSQPCIKTADNILGMIAPQYAVVDHNVKYIFIFESPPENVEQTQWWDRLIS